MFSISVNICAMSLERSFLSWTLMAGLEPSAFSSLSLVAPEAPSDVLTITCMSAGSVWCGESVARSSMMPWIISLPSYTPATVSFCFFPSS